MEVLRCHNMILKGSLKRWIPVSIAAGAWCSYDKIKPYFTASAIHAASGEDNSWINNLLLKRDSPPSLPDDTVNEILTRQEYTCQTRQNEVGPISWFETNHYKANDPIEDRHCECYLKSNDSYFFGVFDGHSGWHCAESLRLRLPLYMSIAFMSTDQRSDFISKNILSKDMVEYLSNPLDDCPFFKTPETFAEKQKNIKSGSAFFAEKASNMVCKLSTSDTLKYTYLSMDRDITREAIPDGKCNETIWSGLSGACAIGAYIKGSDIYVAGTGDCRAVLGIQTNSGSWIHIPMSVDHTSENSSEIERLQKEHPNETDTLIMNNRLLGQLQPLRAFGDVVYKWTKELHREVLDTLYGRAVVPPHMYKTAPYLTAQPDVNHKQIERDDRFIILACDGLWDTISNDDAVKIIGKYLDDMQKGIKPTENGATKLIRYALGQNDRYKLADMLLLPNYQKRNYHDDITVTVVYFNQDYELSKSKL